MKRRILAISDIHGQFDEFQLLLQIAEFDAQQDQLILMGDYIDRGPKSQQVVTLAQQLEQQGAIVLCGNHEAIMQRAYAVNDERAWYHWVDICGGDATLASYNINPSDTSPYKKRRTAAIDRTLQWIQTLPLYYETDQAIFVHAGVDNSGNLHTMSKRTLLWSREEFYRYYHGDKLIVFGHTTTPRLHQDPYNSDVYIGNNHIIGIDGASSLGGQLHCLEYPSLRVYSV